MKNAKLYTEITVFDIELFDEDAPNTVRNFCKLAKNGFYDGLKFFKVIPNFIIQTGCPENTGMGDAGYFIKCEIYENSKSHRTGTLSMAHCGRDTGSSQFFICLSERNIDHLDGNHTCFGQITSNQETLNNHKEGTIIKKIEILE